MACIEIHTTANQERGDIQNHSKLFGSMMVDSYKLEIGNSKELLKSLPDNSIDAIVTDPPYELGFMGKKWDASGIAYDVDLWKECLRVLKHGGHLVAFSGSRTYHRMTVAIEDAGFDIRDQIMWVYGSGFPKSHDVSKAIDKSDATDAAKEWNGWGTALKPAHEPICVARKPLIGTVAENVLQYGTGAFNIDGCRVGVDGATQRGSQAPYPKNTDDTEDRSCWARTGHQIIKVNQGRWPANLIHDGSAEVLAGFPNVGASTTSKRNPNGTNGKNYVGDFGLKAQPDRVTGYNEPRGSAARFFYCAKASKRDRDEGCGELEERARQTMGSEIGMQPDQNKVNNRNHHPTVKPTDLMRYLCRLVTPTNGLILDPFTGSGSTGKAAILEGFRFIGFDMQHEYIEIAKARIEFAVQKKNEIEIKKENTLFDE